MRLLLDECVPRRLKREFVDHDVRTVREAGFSGLKNGKLIEAAAERFDVLETVDKNIRHQQSRAELPIAIIVLSSINNRYESLSPLVPAAIEKITVVKTGEILTVGD